MSWTDAGVAALWVATVGQTVFVLVYASRPFWRHFVGRALMTKSAALMVTLQVTLLNVYVAYPYQLQVGVFLMWLIAIAIVIQTVALFVQQRIDRRTGA